MNASLSVYFIAPEPFETLSPGIAFGNMPVVLQKKQTLIEKAVFVVH